MNRIISLFVTISLILCMPCFSVQASDSVSVTIENPLDGSTVENTAFEVELSTTGAVSETVLEFDGDRMTDNALTESMLTLGEHTLTAYVIGDDGSVESATSTFSVVKSIDAVRINNDLNDASKFPSDHDLEINGVVFGNGKDNSSTVSKNLKTNVQVVRQTSKNWKSTVTKVAGPDGENDEAYNLTSSVGNTGSSRPALNINFADENISTTATVEIDFKLNSDTRIKMSLVAVDPSDSTKTVTAYLFDNSDIYLFSRTTSTGTIAGQSDFKYEVGKWYHVKFVFDIKSTGTEVDLIVSHKNDDGETVTMTVLTDSVISAIKAPINRLAFDYGGGGGMGYSFDNVYVAETPVYTGIEKLGFVYDTIDSSDVYPDAAFLTAIKAYMNERVIAADLSDKFELTDSNGTPVELSIVSASDDGMEVTVVPTQTLAANTEYKLTAKLSASYLGECLDTDRAVVTFKTAADSYAMTGADLKVGSTNLLTAAQLKGKKLTSNVHFSNSETDGQDISVILAIRSGKKLVGLKIVNATVPGGSSDYIVPLETGIIPDDITNAKIQIMLLDNMKSRKSVFATYEVNY